MDGSHLRKEENKDAITSLMLLTKKETEKSRVEHAQMAMVSVENPKKKMQHPQQFQLKLFLLNQTLIHMRDVMWQPLIYQLNSYMWIQTSISS